MRFDSHTSLPGGRSRQIVVEWWRPGPVPWVVKTRGPPGSRQVKREDADSTAESSLSDQISDRDTARRGGRSGIPGAGQDNPRRRNETNRMRRHAGAVALCAHNPEVAGSNPAPATNVVAGQRPFPSGRGSLALAMCNQMCSRNRHGIASEARSGGTCGDD
jgi:hypothetical protein